MSPCVVLAVKFGASELIRNIGGVPVAARVLTVEEMFRLRKVVRNAEH